MLGLQYPSEYDTRSDSIKGEQVVCGNCGRVGHFDAEKHCWVHTNGLVGCKGNNPGSSNEIFRPVSKHDWENRRMNETDVRNLFDQFGRKRHADH